MIHRVQNLLAAIGHREMVGEATTRNIGEKTTAIITDAHE